MNAIERLRDAQFAWEDEGQRQAYLDAAAAVDALYQAAKDMEARVVHGPDFDLGEIFNAAGRLAAAVRRVEGE